MLIQKQNPHMFKPDKKSIIFLSILLASIVLTVIVAVFATREFKRQDTVVEAPIQLSVKPDRGINVDLIDSQKVVFERYRFYDTETGEEVDIHLGGLGGVEVLITEPNGSVTKLPENLGFYPMRIFSTGSVNDSSGQQGLYEFQINFDDGRRYEASLNFSFPQEATLVSLGTTKTLEDGTKMAAYDLVGVDFSEEIQSAFDVLQNNAVRYFVDDIDEYIWFPEDVISVGEHIILVKQEGVWYFTMVTFDERYFE